MNEEFASETDVNQVKKQNQQSMQKMHNQKQNQNAMTEEFGSETDVNQVRKQNQQSEANKTNASGQRSNQFENGSK